MSFFNKLYSVMTAAPRAVRQLAQGDIKDFKFVENKAIGQAFKDNAIFGVTVIGGIATGGLTSSSMLGNLGNPKTGLGGLSGGVTFGGESAKNTILPFVVITAVVITLITLFAIFKPKGRK